MNVLYKFVTELSKFISHLKTRKMGLWTRKEFAEKIGKSVTHVNVYISRGKLQLEADGKHLSMSNFTNLLYLKKLPNYDEIIKQM